MMIDPICVSQKDELTDGTAKQILKIDRKGQQFCKWKCEKVQPSG